MGSKTHIWAYVTPSQASNPSELPGLTEKILATMLNATNIDGQTFLAKWVRGTC